MKEWRVEDLRNVTYYSNTDEKAYQALKRACLGDSFGVPWDGIFVEVNNNIEAIIAPLEDAVCTRK